MINYKKGLSGYIYDYSFTALFKIVCIVVICLLFSRFAGDSSTEESMPEEVGLTIIEGRYKGVWTWELGDGTISMIITPGTTSNGYNIDYFKTNNYRPRRRMDSVWLDARGTLTVNGINVSINLFRTVDDSHCPVTFIGTRTFNDRDELDLKMIIDDCYANA
jgi:hypothetical protein